MTIWRCRPPWISSCVSWNPWVSSKPLENIEFHWFRWFCGWLTLESKQRPTKTSRTWKFVSNFLKHLGKVHFQGWNQSSNSLKWWPRDDRHIEYFEIHGFHKKIIVYLWFQWFWWWLAISRVRNELSNPDRTWKFVSNLLKRLGKVHFRSAINFPIVWSRELVTIATLSILKSMDFTKILRNHWFSLISVTLVVTSELESTERATKTRQNVKLCF